MSSRDPQFDLSPDPTFAIEPVSMTDVKSMARVHIQSWQETYRGIIADSYLDGLSYDHHVALWAQIVQSESSAFLAKSDGRIAGIAHGGRCRAIGPNRAGSGGELFVLYVLKNAQKQGIGRALFDCVHHDLAARGHGGLTVRVLADNPAADFYARLGGTEVGTVNIEVGKQFLEEKIFYWED